MRPLSSSASSLPVSAAVQKVMHSAPLQSRQPELIHLLLVQDLDNRAARWSPNGIGRLTPRIPSPLWMFLATFETHAPRAKLEWGSSAAPQLHFICILCSELQRF